MKPLLPLLLTITGFVPALHAQTITPEFADSYSITSFASPWGEIGHTPFAIPYPRANLFVNVLDAGQSTAALYLYGISRYPSGTGHVDTSVGLFLAGHVADLPYAENGLVLLDEFSLPYGLLAYTTTQGSVGLSDFTTATLLPVTQFGLSGNILTTTPSTIGRSDDLTFISAGGMFLTGTLSGASLENYAISVTDPGIHLVDHPMGVGYVTSPVRHIESPSLLVLDSDHSGTLSVFTLDAFGLPIASSKRDIVTGIPDGYGLTIDNVTGDVFVGGNNGGTLYEIQGFTSVPEPYSCGIAAFVLLGFAFGWRKFSVSPHAFSIK